MALPLHLAETQVQAQTQTQTHRFKPGTQLPIPGGADREKKEKLIFYCRHKLQKAFLSRYDGMSYDEAKVSSDIFYHLEEHHDLDSEIVFKTKIHKVLKAIVRLPVVPYDEIFQFKERSMSQLKSWQVTLQGLNPPSTPAPVADAAPHIPTDPDAGAQASAAGDEPSGAEPAVGLEVPTCPAPIAEHGIGNDVKEKMPIEGGVIDQVGPEAVKADEGLALGEAQVDQMYTEQTPVVQMIPPKYKDPQERLEAEIRYYRHKLQKGFVSKDGPPATFEEAKQLSDFLSKLENYGQLEREVLAATKIHKVIKAMLRIGMGPYDEAFAFARRSEAIRKTYMATWANESIKTGSAVSAGPPIQDTAENETPDVDTGPEQIKGEIIEMDQGRLVMEDLGEGWIGVNP